MIIIWIEQNQALTESLLGLLGLQGLFTIFLKIFLKKDVSPWYDQISLATLVTLHKMEFILQLGTQTNCFLHYCKYEQIRIPNTGRTGKRARYISRASCTGM